MRWEKNETDGMLSNVAKGVQENDIIRKLSTFAYRLPRRHTASGKLWGIRRRMNFLALSSRYVIFSWRTYAYFQNFLRKLPFTRGNRKCQESELKGEIEPGDFPPRSACGGKILFKRKKWAENLTRGFDQFRNEAQKKELRIELN